MTSKPLSSKKSGSLEADRYGVDHATQNASYPLLLFITVVLGIGVLYVASSLLIPIVIALLAYLTLRPIVVRICHSGLPKPIASGLLMGGLFAVFAGVATLLYWPTQRWLARGPESVIAIRENLDSLIEPLTLFDRASQQINEASVPDAEESDPVDVAIVKPSVVDRSVLINKTGQMIAFIAAVAVLTFFMLSTGDELLNRILTLLPDEEHRDQVLSRIGDIQESVGRYLSQITFINIAMGTVASIVMWSVGMPTPILWGVLATLFNYIPYVGPLAATLLVFLAAVVSFETLLSAALTALAFWSVTAVEGQFVTPMIIGKTLRVGPVVVLVAVAFWGFLWGLPGVFLAVPLLIVQRQIFKSFKSTYPLAVVLGEDACPPGQECKPVKDDQPIAEVA
ncbi:MAG: AI-2E family transporter [Pirellulaceae bacterium]